MAAAAALAVIVLPAQTGHPVERRRKPAAEPRNRASGPRRAEPMAPAGLVGVARPWPRRSRRSAGPQPGAVVGIRRRRPTWPSSPLSIAAGCRLRAPRTKVPRPLIPLRYFRRRNFVFPLGARTFVNFSYMGGFFLFPILMERVYGYSETRAGLVSTARPLMFSLVGPDRRLRRRQGGGAGSVVAGARGPDRVHGGVHPTRGPALAGWSSWRPGPLRRGNGLVHPVYGGLGVQRGGRRTSSA